MTFRVSPDQLRTRGRAIESAGAGSAGDLNRLQAQTTAGGAAAWGTDDAAARLAAVYQELTAATREALGLLTSGIQDTGSAVRRLSDGVERTDGDAGRDMRRAGGVA